MPELERLYREDVYKRQGNIMLFKIVSESGIAAGVRRIEALTGNGVLEYYKKQEELLHEAAKALKANPAEDVYKRQHQERQHLICTL